MNLLTHTFILLSLVYQFSVLSSCGRTLVENNEPTSVIDSTVQAKRDTVDINLITSILSDIQPKETQFILVRHAEKLTDESDPNLSDAGKHRAERLAILLSELKLQRIYSTHYNRTQQTARPTSLDQGIEVTDYEASDQERLTTHLLENASGETILVVGHSNTIPELINALTGSDQAEHIDLDCYDNLYVVKVQSDRKAEVIQLKY